MTKIGGMGIRRVMPWEILIRHFKILLGYVPKTMIFHEEHQNEGCNGDFRNHIRTIVNHRIREDALAFLGIHAPNENAGENMAKIAKGSHDKAGQWNGKWFSLLIKHSGNPEYAVC